MPGITIKKIPAPAGECGFRLHADITSRDTTVLIGGTKNRQTPPRFQSTPLSLPMDRLIGVTEVRNDTRGNETTFQNATDPG